VRVKLNFSVLVSDIEGNAILRFKISTCGEVFKLSFHWLGGGLSLVAHATTKVGELVHVEPQAVEGQELVHAVQVGLPPSDGNWVEEIREGGIVGPHLPDEDFAVDLHENIVLHSILVGRVVVGG
jgi:hypothetical protein